MGRRLWKNLSRGLLLFLLLDASLLTYTYVKRDTNLVALSYKIETEKLQKGNSIKVLALSDYHNHGLLYGEQNLLSTLLNEKPDLVCILGDMIDSHSTEEDLRILNQLIEGLKDGGFPIYYVSGNHEEDAPSSLREKADDIYRNNDITVLSPETGNQSTFKKNGDSLGIFGIRDPGLKDKDTDGTKKGGYVYKQMEELAVDKTDYNLFLSHRPAYFVSAKKAGMDLSLAGHTHAGQIALFGVPVFLNPFSRYKYGSYLEEGKRLLINNGLGTSYHLPFRYHCPYSYLSVTIEGKK